jgi:membrane associated rhomboid family serine protease
MRTASVGFQCPECVREGNKNVRQARTVFGASAAGSGLPVVTIGLIVLNFAVYAAELLQHSVVDHLAMLSDAMNGPGKGLYVSMPTAPAGYHLIGVANGQWYRLITSAFVHSLPDQPPFGPLHIVFNMLSLWMFGVVLEQHIGRVRFLAAYLLSALGGSVLCYFLTAPYTQSIGASGAVFGLIGLYFVLSRKLHFDSLGAQRQMVVAVLWLVLAAKYTSWQGHLGGLLTGLAIGLVFAYAPRARQAFVQAAGLVAILALVIGATAVRTSALHTATAQRYSQRSQSTEGVTHGRAVDVAGGSAAEGLAGRTPGR